MKYILVSNRHKHKDLDKMQALFQTLSPHQLFDYDYHKKVLHKKLKYKQNIQVYVTGLTPLVISVVNYCVLMNKPLTLYHYDSDTNTYRAQTVM